MAAKAFCSRWKIAVASGSCAVSACGNNPLMTKNCFVNPMAANSSCVRATSRNVACCARATNISRVRCESASASTAALYCARCFSNPASGPRQDASPLPSARKSLHAPGSCSNRMVWPVGAVSKII